MKIIGKNFIKAICFTLILALWASLVSPIIRVTNGKSIGLNIYTLADSFNDRKAYIGGYPIGLSIKPEGIIVAAIVPIETSAGQVTPTTEVLPGDIIQAINSIKVLYCTDIVDFLQKAEAPLSNVNILVQRSNKIGRAHV